MQEASIRLLSDIDSQLSEIESALSSTSDLTAQRELLKALDEIDQLSRGLAIERRLSLLTPKQLATCDAWLDAVHGIILAYGPNRSGKTFGLAPAIAYDIRELAPPNSLYLCVAKSNAQSVRCQQKELWDLLQQDKLDTEWTGYKNGFGSRNPTVVYDPGGRNITIIFMSQEQYSDNWSAFEAITAYRVWADESISAGLMSAVGMRIATAENAKVGISSIGNEEWMDDLLAEAEVNPRIFVQAFAVSDNPVMDEEKKERQKLFASFGGDDMYAMRIEGKMLTAGARVYREFDRKKHIITYKEFLERTQEDVCWYAGMDCGMDHPTAWILLAVGRDGTRYIVREYTSRNTTVDDDVRKISGILGDRQLIWPTVADPAMWQNRKTGMEAEQYRKAGLRLMPAMRTHKFGEDYGVNIIKYELESERLFVVDRCEMTISNFYKWKYKRDREGNPLEQDRYEDKNNDCLDALRYLLTKNPRYQGKGKFTVIPYD